MRFLTLADVAETLNISSAQAYALVRSGDLQGDQGRRPRQWRVEATELGRTSSGPTSRPHSHWMRPSTAATCDSGTKVGRPAVRACRKSAAPVDSHHQGPTSSQDQFARHSSSQLSDRLPEAHRAGLHPTPAAQRLDLVARRQPDQCSAQVDQVHSHGEQLTAYDVFTDLDLQVREPSHVVGQFHDPRVTLKASWCS